MKKNISRAKPLIEVSLMSAFLIVSQVALAALPNIELVSLLVILYALRFERRAVFAIYVFVLLEGIIFGFGLWWIVYLYVWMVLYFIARLFRGQTHSLFWAFISGAFGLFFGAMSSLPYFITVGIGGGIAYFIAGIPFDLIHCGANFLVALILFKPLDDLLKRVGNFFES